MKNFSQKFIRLLALVCIMTANLFAQTPEQFCTINLGSIVGDVYGTYDCGGNCVPNGADISACVFFQYDINASYDLGYSDGEASVNPDDGVNQSDVDGAYFIGFSQGAASVIPEDGIGQEDVDAAFTDGVASVEVTECEEISTQNIPLYLSEGWSMFGYTCLEPIDAIDGFIEIVDNISIVKDYLGNAYLPSWDFNGIGSLEFARGYQIKMIEEVNDFQFCPTLATKILGCTDPAACNYDSTSNTDDYSCYNNDLGCGCDTPAADVGYDCNGNCLADTDTDGVCDEFEIEGCQDDSYYNYNAEATDSGVCIPFIEGCTTPSACNFEPEANTDNESCYNNNLGCGCDNPAPIEGLNCEGTAIQIGDEVYGGMVFQINEDGSGLVVSMEDIEVMTWSNAQNEAANATTEGYDDWYLPNIDQLEALYNSIGPGGNNSLGLVFQAGHYPSHWKFWSSSVTPSNSNYVYILNFVDGEINENYYSQNWTYSSRAIRSF